jgi:hypothetical protein
VGLDKLIETVKDLILGDDDPNSNQNPENAVRPSSEDPLGDPADSGSAQEVLPASQDPYGDPADEPTGGLQGVLPASQDPLGDPADDVAQEPPPASQDPLGDPADRA